MYQTINKSYRQFQEQKKPRSSEKNLVKLRKMELRHSVKELHFCQKQQIAVILTSDAILVFNTIFGEVTALIKKLSFPRYVTLSSNGKLIVAYFSDNTVSIMDMNGKQISNIIGIPLSSSIFLMSKNCKKIMYGNNQQICLWDVEKAEIEIMTRQWKNINCYALSDDGKQFALGTYCGSIFVLTIVGEQRVTQFQIKRHSKCIMCLTFHGQNIISVSYDKIFIETIIETNVQGQKVLTYSQHLLNEVPRSLVSCGDKVYMSYMSGLFWFQDGKLIGFSQGAWSVLQNEQIETIFIKYDKAEIEWWKFE